MFHLELKYILLQKNIFVPGNCSGVIFAFK